MSAGKHHGVRFSAAGAALLGHLATKAAADYQTNCIRIEYVAPKNAQHQPIYDTLKQNQALEQVQKIFGAFQLPKQRAKQCQNEYGDLSYAFHKLIGPHVDHEIAKRVMQRQGLAEPAPN